MAEERGFRDFPFEALRQNKLEAVRLRAAELAIIEAAEDIERGAPHCQCPTCVAVRAYKAEKERA